MDARKAKSRAAIVAAFSELLREEDYGKLVARMDELGMDKTNYEWYLNLRKFGGCTHSGFGMGFERLLIYLTGVDNIRDVIPYARTPMNCEF